MKLQIEITMENAAFEPDCGQETAWILRHIADGLETTGTNVSPCIQSLRDVNGNHVGTAKIVD